MMQDNIDISELYDNGTISGETYLFCVENDITTLSDIKTFTLTNNVSETVHSDFIALTQDLEPNIEIEESESIVTSDNIQASRISTEEIEEYVSYISKRITKLDQNTLNLFEQLRSRYCSDIEFIEHLLTTNEREDLPSELFTEDEEQLNLLLDFIYDIKTSSNKYSICDEIFVRCNDRRSYNILRDKFEYYGNKLEFSHWLETCQRTDIMLLNSCGRKSYGIIWDLIQRLRILCSEKIFTTPTVINTNITSPAAHNNEISEFIRLIECERKSLSVRANNILKTIISDRHNSFSEVLTFFRTPGLSFLSFRNCGRKADKELRDFRERILNKLKDRDCELTNTVTENTGDQSTIEEIELKTFIHLFESRRPLLSVRANNIIMSILDANCNKYDKVLFLFRSPNLTFQGYRNCGRGTEKELQNFRHEIITYLDNTIINNTNTGTIKDEIKAPQTTTEVFINKSFQLIEPIVKNIIESFSQSSRDTFEIIFQELDFKVSEFYKVILNSNRPITRYLSKRYKSIANIDDINALKERLLDIYNSYRDIIEYIYLSTHNDSKVYSIIKLWIRDSEDLQPLIEKLLSLDKYNLPDVPGIGPSTVQKILNLSQNVRDIFDVKGNIINIDDSESSSLISEWAAVLNLPVSYVSAIHQKANEIGHFPLFFAIQKHIENLSIKDYTILLGQVDIYNEQVLRDRKDIGKELNMTHERVRQLRSKILDDLRKYIISIHTIEDFPYQTIEALNNINLQEETNFQDNFIYWVASICNKTTWTLIGVIDEVFYNPHGHQVNLNIVPTILAKVYDFKKFIRNFDKIYRERRSVNTKIDLQTYCLKFFKESIQIAFLEDIIHECKKIILRTYDCTPNGDIIELESNAYRGIPDIVAEILENNGSPMTTEEIYKVLKEEYPEKKCTNLQSCKIHISKNERIVNLEPVGRKALFALVEWNAGDKRNSSIREIAEEFIMNSDDKIVLLDELCDYIRPYRPDYSNASLRRTLITVNEGFSLYEKLGKQYIGFTARAYSPEYVEVDSLPDKRTVLTSCKELEKFITTNKRFPYLGDECTDDENRLARFWQRTQKKKKDNQLFGQELEEVTRIEEEYSLLFMPKYEFYWRQEFNEIHNKLMRSGKHSLFATEHEWCEKYIKLLKYNRLTDWQVPLIERIKNLYAKI